jgi:pimeloyl-ACP methyl ester carboxylesterase
MLKLNRKRVVLIGLTALLILAASTFSDLVSTIRLMRNLGDAARQQVDPTGITQTEIRIRHGEQELIARVYQPDAPGPKSALIFVPGLTPNGILNPRFVGVAQALAKSGFVVVTPRLTGFDDFRLEPLAIDEIALWYQEIREKPWFQLRRAGIAGVSVGGTLALIAAARKPECRNVDFLISIGGYQNLARCERRWFSQALGEDKHGHYPVQSYGKWVLMLMALEGNTSPNEQAVLQTVLNDLILRASTSVSPGEMSPEAASWYRFAVSHDVNDQAIMRKISSFLESRHRLLSPDLELAAINCPVFLVHGAHDELIAPEESLELELRLISAPTTRLLTPIISHTHPLLEKMSPGNKARALAEGALFLYRLVKVS